MAEHDTDDLEVVSSNSTGAIFDEIYFVLCRFRSVRLSDRIAYREKLNYYGTSYLTVQSTVSLIQLIVNSDASYFALRFANVNHKG